MKNSIPRAATVFSAAVLSVALFSGTAADTRAQMAAPLKISPPLMEILMTEPPYVQALRQFRELLESPKRETLTPYDYSMMAMIVWQGAKENAVTLQDALDTLVVLHKNCPDPKHRHIIANKAEVLFRPASAPAFIETLTKMKEAETDETERAYITRTLENIEARTSPPPVP